MHYISFYRTVAAGLLIAALTIPSLAQTAGGWSNVEALAGGTAVMVEQAGQKTLKGRFSRATPDSLFLMRDGREIEIPRDTVSAVYLSRKSSRAKRAVIGGLAGVGAGVLIGVVTVAATKGDPLIAAGGVLFGLPIGAAIGAGTGGTKKGELIYRR